jgi:phosphoglycolate phosphatase
VHLLFDLDGTLTDSAPGIVRCINHALAELGEPCAGDAELRALIGSPLQAIFARLLAAADSQRLGRAVSSYRSRFDCTGIYENSLFPGIDRLLADLRGRGHALQLVTIKPADVAQRVLDHFEIARFFDAVHGPDPDDEHCDKARLVGSALERAGGLAADALMIGDRVADVAAARAHGVRAIGVGWGYGAPEELLSAGAMSVVSSAAELVALVQVLDGPPSRPLPRARAGAVSAATPLRNPGSESSARPRGSR